jgi:hypothetical protein
MSLGTIVYLAGMLAMFVSERLLEGHDSMQWAVRLGAIAAIGFAFGLRLRALPRAAGEGLRLAHRTALLLLLVGAGSLVLYWASTEAMVERFASTEEGRERVHAVFACAWPIVFLVGTIPLLVVDHALRSSPVVLSTGRVRAALVHGLAAALGLAFVFPANYVASKTNERWDLAYFKTPTPGTATHAIVDSLPQPVAVRIFMPPSSEVAQELRAYFAALEGGNLTVEIVDQAAQPRLSRALSVRDNGTIAFTQGDISVLMDEPEDENAPPDAKDDTKADAADPKDDRPKPVTRRVTVSPDFEKAKRTLKKIDREVQKALLELSQGERIAYFTAGHGELDWSGEQNPVRSLKAFRDRLRDLGFKMKNLGLREGLGEAVPEDASVVIIAGPRRPFLAAETAALKAYLDRGGSVFFALGPKISLPGQPRFEDPMDALLEELGVRRGDGVLAADANIVVINHNNEDRFNVFTNSFTAHGSTSELASMSKRDFLFIPASGFLEEVEGADTEVTFTVRSLSTAWADLDADTELDADAGETKDVRSVVAAVTGAGGEGGFRAIVTPAATALVDLSQTFAGNAQFVDDSMNWLIGAEELGGTTESEEDVKIEHTKEGQAFWFHLTVLGVPMGVLLLGAMRLRLRRKGGAR